MAKRTWVATFLAATLGVMTWGSLAPRNAAAQGVIFGLSGEGGGFVGEAEGAMGGAAARLGIDFDGVRLYAQVHGLVGALTAGVHGGTATGLLWNTIMFGPQLGVFEMAVGPSLDVAWGCEAQEGCVHGGPNFGLDARLALHFGGLVISADVHPTFLQRDPILAVVGGIGFEI